MPRRDGTGPAGQGAISGRGLGFCTDVYSRGYGAEFRRGYGRECGRGRAWGMKSDNKNRRGFYNDDTRKANALTKREILIEQKSLLQGKLADLNQQLDQLAGS